MKHFKDELHRAQVDEGGIIGMKNKQQNETKNSQEFWFFESLQPFFDFSRV